MRALSAVFDIALATTVSGLGLACALMLYGIGFVVAAPGMLIMRCASFFAMSFAETLDEVLDRERR